MPIIGGTAIYFGLSLVFVWVGSKAILLGGSVWISNLYSMTVGPVMMVGYWFLCLKLLGGQQASSRDVFSAFPRFRAAWVTNLLFTLITIGGFVLLVVPGIVWSLKYGLSFFAVMDRTADGCWQCRREECTRVNAVQAWPHGRVHRSR